MKTSGLFTTHSYRIPIHYNQPFRLVFFGDIHRDSDSHAKREWQEFLKYARPLKNAFFFGVGDYIDSMSTSEREAILHANLHESTTKHLEDVASSTVSVLAKELAFMKGRLIGLLNGNHFAIYPNGVNSDQRLAEKLECKYLGVSSFVRLSLNTAGRVHTLDLWAHHGKGAGRLLGGSINRVDQMREHADADIYVMGDDHARFAVPANPRMELHSSSKAGLQVIQKQQFLVRSGSFLNSYEDGCVNYNVDAARGPRSIGHVELIITPKIGRRNGNTTPVNIEIRGLS